jgi:hypothetical protein
MKIVHLAVDVVDEIPIKKLVVFRGSIIGYVLSLVV